MSSNDPKNCSYSPTASQITDHEALNRKNLIGELDDYAIAVSLVFPSGSDSLFYKKGDGVP